MAAAVILPKLGNTVESSIILNWLKQPGDKVQEGEPICAVETDKAVLEVESPAAGILLARFFEEGDEAPVLTAIAAVGQPGDDISHLMPKDSLPNLPGASRILPASEAQAQNLSSEHDTEHVAISPRARLLANRKNVDYTTEFEGSGPGGRIIQRDIEAALDDRQRLTPVAQAMVESGDYFAPMRSGRITKSDLISLDSTKSTVSSDDMDVVSVKGVRAIIAKRMLVSMQTTAQLTLNTSADARSLLAYRKKLKTSVEQLNIDDVSINDLILYATSRTLLQHPELNAHFTGDEIHYYKHVNLGFAVDTPRGLLVPVIHDAHRLSLKGVSAESKRLAKACIEGYVTPDDLADATFTVTNLGSLGIETFTPILDPPQVAIIGVGSINLKPVLVEDEVEFIPHIGLSLTINHQAVDGAPGARFLQTLSYNLANLTLMLAL